MAREDRTTAGRPNPAQPRPRNDGQNGDWYGGERENEFGGEPRFRAEGGHGSHFGGEPEALGAGETGKPEPRNTKAWLGERRRKFIERFERWRRERAARAAKHGFGSASNESAPAEDSRGSKK